MRQHSMQCPMALQRLVVVGLPATVEHGGRGGATNSAAVVAEITAAFITCLDSVRLNMLAVDQVPLPRELPRDTDSCLDTCEKPFGIPAVAICAVVTGVLRVCTLLAMITKCATPGYHMSTCRVLVICCACCRCCPASATACQP